MVPILVPQSLRLRCEGGGTRERRAAPTAPQRRAFRDVNTPGRRHNRAKGMMPIVVQVDAVGDDGYEPPTTSDARNGDQAEKSQQPSPFALFVMRTWVQLLFAFAIMSTGIAVALYLYFALGRFEGDSKRAAFVLRAEALSTNMQYEINSLEAGFSFPSSRRSVVTLRRTPPHPQFLTTRLNPSRHLDTCAFDLQDKNRARFGWQPCRLLHSSPWTNPPESQSSESA